MNKVYLHGRITRDVEMRHTQSGKAVAAFSVATNEGYGDKQHTDFHNCVAWEKTAEIVGNHFVKGSEILLEGKLQTRSWDANDGTKRYATEVIVRSIDFCGSKKAAETPGGRPASANWDSTPKGIPDELIPF